MKFLYQFKAITIMLVIKINEISKSKIFTTQFKKNGNDKSTFNMCRQIKRSGLHWLVLSRIDFIVKTNDYFKENMIQIYILKEKKLSNAFHGTLKSFYNSRIFSPSLNIYETTCVLE